MAADDDDEMTPEDPEEEVEEEEDGDLEEEPDAEELDEDEDGAFVVVDDDDDAEVVDRRRRGGRGRRRSRRRPDDAHQAAAPRGEEEEDEDEEMLSPDDVEADLDRILKDRLVTAEDEDDDEDEDEPDERGDPGDRLQPKRADEQLCPNCFLLVRANGPGLSGRRRRLPDLPLRTDDMAPPTDDPIRAEVERVLHDARRRRRSWCRCAWRRPCRAACCAA